MKLKWLLKINVGSFVVRSKDCAVRSKDCVVRQWFVIIFDGSPYSKFKKSSGPTMVRQKIQWFG